MEGLLFGPFLERVDEFLRGYACNSRIIDLCCSDVSYALITEQNELEVNLS